MTFKEAKIRLENTAKGKYRAIQYEETIDVSGKTRCVCSIYIDTETWYNGETWGEAFQARDLIVNPAPYTTEGQPD